MPSACQTQTQQNRTTRCPHILQIGESFQQILALKLKQYEFTLKQNSVKSNKSLTCQQHDVDYNNEKLEQSTLVCTSEIELIECNDCKCYKNLWLCLKENCYYVGCGQDQASNKHSSDHATRSYHPLSINLATKNVWCELCSIRVNIDSNLPSLNSCVNQNDNLTIKMSSQHANDSKKVIVDDFEVINYLDKENYLKKNNKNVNDDDEDDVIDQYTQYGQLGLDNLGNTCYMNAAIQALSNCYVFTSFFLECSTYVQQIANINKTLTQSTNRNVLLSINFMKLMKDLWQSPNRINIKTNKLEQISSISPVDFVHSVKLINPMFRGYQQNDSQEFLIYLMDQLHEELKRPILIDEIQIEEDNEDTEDDDTVVEKCDKDSGVSSITNGSMKDDRDTESIDSYVTCGDDDQPSDLSDNLDYSDADECFNRSCCKRSNKKETTKRQKPVHSSIITDTFEGKIMSQVRCLECNNVSTTTESFLHLSIPIPSKEYLQMLQNRILNRETEAINQSPGWFSWLFDFMKGYVWSNTIRLTDCLTAFFSDDDLKGDNMYSCEKCKKLTNGVKYSKILRLPEVLIIHLKRFRHDSMFSTGKISSYISFPIDNLNMQPFVHNECKNEITQYDLSSLIVHYGGSEGGHYISYARNYFNEEWYEYDDSYCRQVESLTVQNAQAYVLFYKKKTIGTDGIKDQLRNIFALRAENNLSESMLRPYYISKQWVHKLKYYGESGAIDNSDFLCKHNFVYPKYWKIVEDLTFACSEETWMYLVENFGLRFERNSFNFKNFTNSLYPCKTCLQDDETLKQRQLYEKDEFLRLQDKWNQDQLSSYGQGRVYAISKSWFKEWERFVQINDCPMEHQIPGEINNLPICMPQKQKDKTKIKNHQLNPKISNFKLSEEMWRFLLNIYGGGPEMLVSSGAANICDSPKEKMVNGKSNL